MPITEKVKSMTDEFLKLVETELKKDYVAMMEELDQLFLMSIANKLTTHRAERLNELLHKKATYDLGLSHVVEGLDEGYVITPFCSR
jgi:hypothetical protein